MIRKLRTVLQPRRTWSYYRKVPMLASLELTHRCNLRCQMCNLWRDYQGKEEAELSTAEWKAVIDGLAELGTRQVTLIGAEPLLRRDVADIAGHIKSKNMACLIVTNGVLLQKRAEELVAAGVDAVTVSIDGPGPQHDEMRGLPGTFEKAKAGLESLVKARRRRGRQGPRVEVHATISATNVSGVSELASHWRDLGADSCSFGYLVEAPSEVIQGSVLDGECVGSYRFTPNGAGSHLLTSAQLPLFRQQLDAARKQDENVADIALFRNLPDSCFLTGRLPVRRCYTLNTRIIVNPYGELIPCPFMDGYSAGNVKGGNVAAAWRSARYEGLRRKVAKELFPMCGYCCYFGQNLTKMQAMRVALGRSL